VIVIRHSKPPIIPSIKLQHALSRCAQIIERIRVATEFLNVARGQHGCQKIEGAPLRDRKQPLYVVVSSLKLIVIELNDVMQLAASVICTRTREERGYLAHSRPE
jgi:hypothetical protein